MKTQIGSHLKILIGLRKTHYVAGVQNMTLYATTGEDGKTTTTPPAERLHKVRYNLSHDDPMNPGNF